MAGWTAWAPAKTGDTAVPCPHPGAPVAVRDKQARQLDAFVVGYDGAVWVTWETDGGAWQNGPRDGCLDASVHPVSLRPDHIWSPHTKTIISWDVFVVGHDGAIWVTWTVDDGPWREGADGRDAGPRDASGISPRLARRSRPPNRAMRSSTSSSCERRRGLGDVDRGRRRLDGRTEWSTAGCREPCWNFAPMRAHLAAARQKSNQLDVFVVRDDGAIWVTWVVGDGAWTDGQNGRRHPVRVSTPDLAPPGAPLSAILQNETQLDVLVVGKGGAIWATWEVNDGGWRDGVDGRPVPVPVSTFNLAPAGAGVAAVRRASGQVDAFTVGTGRIRSFRELPSLLAEATKLGTNVVYLFDYWEGADEGGFPLTGTRATTFCEATSAANPRSSTAFGRSTIRADAS